MLIALIVVFNFFLMSSVGLRVIFLNFEVSSRMGFILFRYSCLGRMTMAAVLSALLMVMSSLERSCLAATKCLFFVKVGSGKSFVAL